jgi:hypothetical protein
MSDIKVYFTRDLRATSSLYRLRAENGRERHDNENEGRSSEKHIEDEGEGTTMDRRQTTYHGKGRVRRSFSQQRQQKNGLFCR